MGGVLTTGFSWRAPFWFLAAVSGLSGILILLFLKDTFRKERSLTYQNVLKSRLKSHATASVATSRTASIAESPSLPADLEKQQVPALRLSDTHTVAAADVALREMKLTFRDVNPFRPLWLVVRRMNNLAILVASGLMFGYNFVVVFTTSRTLSSAYGYNALEVGLVLLSFGLGMPFMFSCLPLC
jgi:predicted MFS family arabinose efflux permease